jgi:hypothetical protein
MLSAACPAAEGPGLLQLLLLLLPPPPPVSDVNMPSLLSPLWLSPP